MIKSEKFHAQLRKERKTNPLRTEKTYRNQIKSAFFRNTDILPEEMREDLFLYFDEKAKTAPELQEYLSISIDLFNEEYDPEERLFSDGDWEYMKEITAEFGIELDEKILTYVMNIILEKGLFHKNI